eukprot:Skav222986  [mRNA]  locus=scaffold1827:160248:160454:+ [translate_table: standard]
MVSDVTAMPVATNRSAGDTALLVKAEFTALVDTKAEAQMRCNRLATGMVGEKGMQQARAAAMTLATIE